MTQQAYPLAWPPGFPRTKERERSKFKTTLASSLGNVRRSLELFGKDSRKPISALVISSNYSLGDERPADPGVAVYFQWDAIAVCIPVDRYVTLADNLQAIHHIIEARRVELRHGSLQLIRATFTGFTALPPPNAAYSWRMILDCGREATLADAERKYREKARKAHPDNGGSHADMARLNQAITEARREFQP
ncbi:MAG TPA: J domain-containing protein [Reyranella sp.]|nr:J domain-containing protein [Reyranella sp.]